VHSYGVEEGERTAGRGFACGTVRGPQRTPRCSSTLCGRNGTGAHLAFRSALRAGIWPQYLMVTNITNAHSCLQARYIRAERTAGHWREPRLVARALAFAFLYTTPDHERVCRRACQNPIQQQQQQQQQQHAVSCMALARPHAIIHDVWALWSPCHTYVPQLGRARCDSNRQPWESTASKLLPEE
jgi:hypothetical protein